MPKSYLAVASGLAASFAVFGVFHLISLLLFPMADGSSLFVVSDVRSWLIALPFSAYLIVLAGYALGGLSTGILCSRLVSASASLGIVLITSIAVTSLTAIKAVIVGEPIWMVVATLILIIPFSLLATQPAETAS